jgi:PAS domain S-box-containing protein
MLGTFVVATFVAGIAAAALTIVLLHRSRGVSRRVRLPFVSVVALGGLWSFAYGMQLAADRVATKLLWETVVTLALVPFATCAFVFVVAYTGHGDRLTRYTVGALAVEPAVVLVALLDPRYGVSGDRTLLSVDGTSVLAPDYGTLLTFHHVYTLLLGAAGIALLGDAVRRTRGAANRQTMVLLVGGALPLVSLALYSFRVVPLNPAPAALGVTTAMVGVAMVRYGLFDVRPAVRDVVFEELTDAVVVVDEHDRVVEANASTVDRLGLPVVLEGRPAREVLPSAEEVLSLRDSDAETLEIVVGEEAPRHFEVTASRLDSAGLRAAHVFAFSEVTDQRRTEMQYQALIENSRDMVSVFDADGTKRYASPAIRSVLGYDRESADAMAGFDLVHPDDRSEARATFERAVHGDGPVRTKFRLRTADGTYRLFEGIAVNLLDDPAVRGIVVSSRDVTDRRRYEQRLRVLNRVLRHDLRNEMNVILGYADLLSDSDLSTEQAHFVETIQTKAERITTLSEQTREVVESLPDGDGAPPVDVAAVTRSRLASSEALAPAVTLTADVPTECWARAGAAYDDALDRLLETVVGHSDAEAPAVHVSVDRHTTTDGQHVVDVTLDGDAPGVPEQHRAALAEGAETPLQHLNGFDLWLVNWYVDGVGGELSFDYEGDRRAVRLRLMASEVPQPRTQLGA